MVKVGINGFGRIGRCTFRAGMSDPNFKVVAINDLVPADNLAYLLKYDSVHGTLDADVTSRDDAIFINGQELAVFSEAEPGNVPWGEAGVDVVIEATGLFTDAEDASQHLEGGAKKVVISAPASGEDLTVVLGVNEDKYDPEQHHVISNGSCTTNCLAPLTLVLNREFGIKEGLITTVHAYTQGQAILDAPAKKTRRGRAAAENIIPTTTGAAKAISLVMPELKGKLNGMAMRIPTPNVSVVDFVATLKEKASKESINDAFREAAAGDLEGILACCDEELVSRDFIGDPHSSILDADSTMVVGDGMVKVISWYDNEWGFSNRLVELCQYVVE